METYKKCYLEDFECDLNNFKIKTNSGNYIIKVKNGNINCKILNDNNEEVGLMNLQKNINIKLILKKNKIRKIIIPTEYNFNSESSEDFGNISA